MRAVDWLPDGQGGSLVTQVQDALLCFTMRAGRRALGRQCDGGATRSRQLVTCRGLSFAGMGGLAGRGAHPRVPAVSILVIDESAIPSMAATIGQLGSRSGAAQVAILGAMKELGDGGGPYHAGLATRCVAAGVQFALLVEAKETSPKQRGADRFRACGRHAAAAGRLGALRPGDTVLVKGSNSVGLSHVVTAAMGIIDAILAGGLTPFRGF